ncbi:hypothetical protein Ahy_B09g098468 isoform A [Arachis hypogaea]|uniref:Glycosyl transferase family 1 domain-containing protein n=1 Tax=Arachis hypogaea TaxID=3818 RepID=A0A444XRY7_ARAHY|nr:hypothetical protein Ahy_B09g098468 isoform A [Arachis hypogaea]
MAPFLSGGGYSSEAWSYVLSLHSHTKMHSFRLYRTECRMNETIVVCHSEPGAWYPPLFQTFPCPPSPFYSDFKSVIGRTMFETDRVNGEHVERCNKMDYVWVPTDFHKSTFVGSGVDPSKVVKIVQPIDVKFFDPAKYKPLDLASRGQCILGSSWEYRKGWDVLLKAYLKEFSKDDNVALFLLTNPYHTDTDFGNKIMDFVESSDLAEPVGGFAPVYRGEGWGRPLVEAMAMSLPVIATNWSGPTEYLTDDNSYPLPVDGMSEVMEGPFMGHLWAEPCVDELQNLMRRVMDHRNAATAKGRKAREDMIRRFSPEIVADIVTEQIENILRQ